MGRGERDMIGEKRRKISMKGEEEREKKEPTTR